MSDFNQIVRKIAGLYELLEDQLSKDIFISRLACDVCLTGENMVRLFSVGAQLHTLVVR